MYIEISAQSVPRVDDGPEFPVAPSRPLHELHSQAPTYALDDGEWPYAPFKFSNDASQAYWEQLQVRQYLHEYQEATNRTAILLGESCLLNALVFMPEETILVVDFNPHSTYYMLNYIANLRLASTAEEWKRLMVSYLGRTPVLGDSEVEHFEEQMAKQLRMWEDTGVSHSLNDAAKYNQAHSQAQQKAIIPWNADIKNRHEMAYLGRSLRALDANVTFINLSNTMGYSCLTTKSEHVTLDELPITPNAPILTSSVSAIPFEASNGDFPANGLHLTGPFFGLGNLLKQGGIDPTADYGPSDAFERRYMQTE